MEKGTNKISLSKLKEIINIIKVENVNDDEVFDFIKLLKNQKESVKSKSVLFFPTYLDSSDDGGGWYIGKCDYRLEINDFVKEYPNYTYVLDEKAYQLLKDRKIKTILVDPLGEKDLRITGLNRKVEARIVKHYEKRGIFERGKYYG